MQYPAFRHPKGGGNLDFVPVLSDVNLDGKLDVVSAGAGDYASVVLNLGTPGQ
jgi:hypothetical protein